MESTTRKRSGNGLIYLLLIGAAVIIAGATGVTAMFLHFISCMSGD